MGIFQLGFSEIFGGKLLSTSLILISVISLYISVYNSDTEKFDKEGIRLTKLFNKLKDLYFSVKSSTKNDFTQEKSELDEIMKDFYSNTISKQVFLSHWFAHFKFFYEMQIDWINEQLNFQFFKDKVPNSLKIFLLIVLLTSIIFICYEYFGDISTASI
ncbi:SLATT domain-containing protein [Lutibacter agarilyticus]|uniref:SLATT domain-containing protein n=1 Tax=Lutibacter agarilyticus TaxID=1109740 RepID=UPI001131E319